MSNAILTVNCEPEYSTKDTRLCGKNSASRYIFCDTSSADAGKELRIELTTYTHKYSGVINPVYCGDRAEIWVHLFEQNGLETVMHSSFSFPYYQRTFQYRAGAGIQSQIRYRISGLVYDHGRNLDAR